MTADDVESLLRQGRPTCPPAELRQRVLAAADHCRPKPPVSLHPRIRVLGVLTVAASILALVSTVIWAIRIPAPVRGPAALGQDSGQPFEERRVVEGSPEDRVSGFVWSSDGKHWAYVCTNRRPTGITYAAVVDGKMGPEYYALQAPHFGEGGHFAYLAREGSSPNDALVLDGIPQQDFDGYTAFAWSPDGKRLAFVGRKQQRAYVVQDGKPGEPFDEATSLLWSPDGSRLAYLARVNREWFVVLGGVKEEPFDEVAALTFSPDGKRLAYRAKEGKYVIMVGGEKSGEYDYVGRPVWGPGGMFAYGVVKDKKSWVVAGRWPDLRGRMMNEGFEEVGTPAFSGDGKSWAYRAKAKGREAIVLETMEKGVQDVGEEFDSVGDPLVGPDRHSVAFVAGKGFQKYMVVGGRLTHKFALIDRATLSADGKAVA